jgi:two-component system response regulator HydG
LFGYEKGAFTGADSQRKGKVESAHGGTLFLDEIGDIPGKMQKDLLRFLQERTFFRVGGNREQAVDVRVIAATRADLQRGVLDGSFRDDLFYRLNVINIRLPPLRERIEDIPLLARHFVERISVEVGREVEGLTDEALRVLMGRDWPGNVRELENAIERAIVTARQSVLDERDFAFLLEDADTGQVWAPPADLSLADIERRAIETTLGRTQGNIKLSARLLGIDRSTLYEKIRKLGLQRPFGGR